MLGTKQLSFFCLRRSVFYTILFSLVLATWLQIKSPWFFDPLLGVSGGTHGLLELTVFALSVTATSCMLTTIPDFICIWKSRILLSWLRKKVLVKSILAICITDLVSSFVILWLSVSVIFVFALGYHRDSLVQEFFNVGPIFRAYEMLIVSPKFIDPNS